MPPKEIQLKSKINAEVEIPGSKSYTNRALIIATLANESSKLTNASLSDDARSMIDGLQMFGVEIKEDGTTLLVTPPEKLHYDGEIDVGGAGTTMRFLTGFCSLGFGNVKLVGDDVMHTRPIDDLVESLHNLIGGSIKAESINANGRGCPPVSINSNGLVGGTTNLKGDTSSQYLTSILMVSPYASKDVEIQIIGDLTSKPYADITIDVMKQFGINVERKEYKRFFVGAGQKYAGRPYQIEFDASNSSYFLAAAAITGGRVKVRNINPYSVQGDIHFPDLLDKMGCKVNWGSDYVEVTGPEKLRAIEEINMNSMQDTVQTLAVLAAVAEGTTVITGIGNLRVKETERIEALEAGLAGVGIRTESTEDSLTIYGGKPHGAQIETRGDHRMAMSFSDLGLKIPGIIIDDPDCVSKSYPTFYKDFDRL